MSGPSQGSKPSASPHKTYARIAVDILRFALTRSTTRLVVRGAPAYVLACYRADMLVQQSMSEAPAYLVISRSIAMNMFSNVAQMRLR